MNSTIDDIQVKEEPTEYKEEQRNNHSSLSMKSQSSVTKNNTLKTKKFSRKFHYCVDLVVCLFFSSCFYMR